MDELTWEFELAESFEDDHEKQVAELQKLIDSGQAWRLEGSIGRIAMDAIESGDCILGEKSYRDYWGNYVPSRHEVVPGSKGSIEYAQRKQEER